MSRITDWASYQGC